MRALLLAVLAFGCSVYRLPDAPPEAEDPAAPVECAWPSAEGYDCPPDEPAAYARKQYFEQGGLVVCWEHSYWCGATADACLRQVYECQPTVNPGQP